jgi:Protein of unknown function (DUF998)
MAHTLLRDRPRLAPDNAAKAWSIIAVVGLAAFVSAVVVAGVGNSGYSPLSEGVGGLGAQNATDPDLMNAGFLALAVATVAAGAALLRLLPGRSGVAAAIIVASAGLIETAVAFVRQDCSTARTRCADAEVSGRLSLSHTLHQILALGLAVGLIVSLFMMAASLRRLSGGASLAKLTQWAGVASIGMFVWLGSQLYGDLGGVVEKLLMALVYGWPVLLAVALSRQRSTAP